MDFENFSLHNNIHIRKMLIEDECWYSVVDVLALLTNSVNANDYWYRMKVRVLFESKFQLSTVCRRLKLESKDNKKYDTDCANIEGILHIIRYIPSVKVEPFRRFLDGGARKMPEKMKEIEF